MVLLYCHTQSPTLSSMSKKLATLRVLQVVIIIKTRHSDRASFLENCLMIISTFFARCPFFRYRLEICMRMPLRVVLRLDACYHAITTGCHCDLDPSDNVRPLTERRTIPWIFVFFEYHELCLPTWASIFSSHRFQPTMETFGAIADELFISKSARFFVFRYPAFTFI